MRAWLETGAHTTMTCAEKVRASPGQRASGIGGSFRGVVSRVGEGGAGLEGWPGGLQKEASQRQRTASGQLGPGGGDEMPFRLRQEPVRSLLSVALGAPRAYRAYGQQGPEWPQALAIS